MTTNTPAASVGLQPGDLIVGVGGRTIETPERRGARHGRDRGKPVVIKVQAQRLVVAIGPVGAALQRR